MSWRRRWVRLRNERVEGIGHSSCLLAQRPSLSVMLNPYGEPRDGPAQRSMEAIPGAGCCKSDGGLRFPASMMSGLGAPMSKRARDVWEVSASISPPRG